MDIDSGAEVFHFKTEGAIYNTPLVVDENLFIGSSDKHLYCYNLEIQKVVKKIKTHGKIYASPRKVGDFVCFGSHDGVLRAVHLQTGKVAGVLYVPERISTPVTYSEEKGLLYVSTSDNQIFCFSRKG